jgi:hypothetical protein
VTTTDDIPVFKVAPNYFKVHQSGLGDNTYLTAAEYIVGTDQVTSLPWGEGDWGEEERGRGGEGEGERELQCSNSRFLNTFNPNP